MKSHDESPSEPAPASGGPQPLLHRLGRAVERIMGADVHPHERRMAFVFFANLFLLLTAYYVLKVIREPLILLGGGTVSRSYARGLQAGLLFLIVPAYGLLANRVEPDRLVKWIMGFFMACLGVFFVLGRLRVPVGFAFFVWLGIFSTLAIAQFWSLANDLLTESEGKRLFPMVAAGGTLGAIVGSQIAARAITWLDPLQLMLVAASLIGICVGLTHLAHGAGHSHRRRIPSPHRSQERDARGGFTLVLQDRYLTLIAGSVFLLNLINTTGDFILAQIVNTHAHQLTSGLADAAEATQAQRRFIGAFYGDFQTYVATATALVQILLVARVFKAMGVARALFLAPLIALVGYGAAGLIPALAVVAAVKVFENSNDYSLQNTIQQALFLRTSRDAKYKAKAAIDTAVVRLGDLGSTGLVFLGVHLGLGVLGYTIANVVSGVIWLVLVVRLARRLRGLRDPSGAPASAAAPSLVGPAVRPAG